MSSYRLMFPGVRSSLVFSEFGLRPPASGYKSYSYSSLRTFPSPFKDNGLPFWVPEVLCHLWTAPPSDAFEINCGIYLIYMRDGVVNTFDSGI